MQLPNVTLYTDGSFKNNQNGGWACLLQCGTEWRMVSDSCFNTTNNRMELTAVVAGLSILTIPCRVVVISDSTLICNTINLWIRKWAKNKFKTSSGTLVANVDLVLKLWDFMQTHNVSAQWVKAHTNKKDIKSLGNKCCDWFAQHSASFI